MKLNDVRIGSAVRVVAGEFEGLAGEVVEVRNWGAAVKFSGVWNGKPFDRTVMVGADCLEILV